MLFVLLCESAHLRHPAAITDWCVNFALCSSSDVYDEDYADIDCPQKDAVSRGVVLNLIQGSHRLLADASPL